jgi:DNA-binding MarR family transcriptional regulator
LSTPLTERFELLEALQQAGRDLSTATVLFHAAMAEQFGLNATDWKCAEILGRMGPLTAGELAELTGLTTGAITGVIDRLEQAGFARRERDPHDRRKVVVQRLPERDQEIKQRFEALLHGYTELLSTYSDQELAFILDYINRSRAVTQEATATLRAKAKSAGQSRQVAAP